MFFYLKLKLDNILCSEMLSFCLSLSLFVYIDMYIHGLASSYVFKRKELLLFLASEGDCREMGSIYCSFATYMRA